MDPQTVSTSNSCPVSGCGIVADTLELPFRIFALSHFSAKYSQASFSVIMSAPLLLLALEHVMSSAVTGYDTSEIGISGLVGLSVLTNDEHPPFQTSVGHGIALYPYADLSLRPTDMQYARPGFQPKRHSLRTTHTNGVTINDKV
jgi:hypothetical protein